jgi:hypothetical protein
MKAGEERLGIDERGGKLMRRSVSAMTGWQRIRPGVWGLSAGMVVAVLALAHAEPGGLAERGRTLYARTVRSAMGRRARDGLRAMPPPSTTRTF